MKTIWKWGELDTPLLTTKFNIPPHQGRPFVFNYLALTLIARGDIEGARRAMEDSDRVLSEIGIGDNPFYKAHNTAYRLALAVAEDDPEG